jgi:hypothetical protein
MATSTREPPKGPKKKPTTAKKGTAKKGTANKGTARKGTAKATTKRPPPRKAKKGAPKAGGSKKAPARKATRTRRYAVSHDDVDRPHMRLGLIWFVALVLALVLGPIALGVLCGLVAGVGGLQVAKAWHRRRQPVSIPAAGLAALLLPVAAAWGGRTLGLALLGGVLLSVAAAAARPSSQGVVGGTGWTVRSWLFVGGPAASLVLLSTYDTGAAIALVILMSAYDAGDYVVGSGARTIWEGPLGGITAVGVLTLSLYVMNLSPFHGGAVVVYGIVLAVLAPLGQVAASAVLPAPDEIASGLRRFDSILLAGPVWAVMLALEVAL